MHFLYRTLSFCCLNKPQSVSATQRDFWVEWSVSPLFGKLIYTPKGLLSTIWKARNSDTGLQTLLTQETTPVLIDISRIRRILPIRSLVRSPEVYGLIV